MQPARSELQSEASRRNGARSLGPSTIEGKALSVANSVQHGLASRAVLLPSEKLADYESNLDRWTSSLGVASEAEAEIVAQIADANFRLARLARQEQEHFAASLEKQVAKSPQTKVITAAKEAQQCLQAMVSTLRGVTTEEHASAVRENLPPAIRAIEKRVHEAELPLAVTVSFEVAVEKFAHDFGEPGVASSGVEKVAALVIAGEAVLAALEIKLPELDGSLVQERERLAEEMLLGEDRELARFERHRGRIGREVERGLKLLKGIRELVPPAPEGSVSGSSVQTYVVELKVLGRKT